jgi:hypothetical protein
MADDILSDDVIDLRARWTLGKVVTQPGLHLHLFVNAPTITAATVLSDFAECAAPGYTPEDLVPSDWTGSTSGGVAAYAYPAITFTFTGPGVGPETIHGHYFTDDLDTLFLWGKTWDVDYPIPTLGGSVTITPSWEDEQCPA